MAPSAIAEHPVKDEVMVPETIEIMPVASKHVPQREDHRTIEPAFKFSQAVLRDKNRFNSGPRTVRALVSTLVHVTVIATPILLGLFFTDTINIKQYAQTLLVAPPPPPPPPATAVLVKGRAVVQGSSPPAKLFAPTSPSKLPKSKRHPSGQTASVVWLGQGHALIDAILDAQGKVIAAQMIVTITFVLGE